MTRHSDAPDTTVMLCEASIHQIFIEIAHRFDYTLIATVSNSGADVEHLRLLYSGGKMPAIGLAQSALMELQNKVLEGEELENEEDKP